MKNKMTPQQVQQIIDNNELTNDPYMEVPVRNDLLEVLTTIYPDKTIDEIFDSILDDFIEIHKGFLFN